MRKVNAMRKETSAIAYAFIERRAARAARTHTDGQTLFLHGNAIAWWEGDILCLSLAGWNTNTTRDRLNGILSALGSKLCIRSKDGEAFLSEIDREKIPMADNAVLRLPPIAYNPTR